MQRIKRLNMLLWFKGGSNMLNKNNMKETKDNFSAWWNNQDIGRPLMKLIAADNFKENTFEFNTFEEKHIGVDYLISKKNI